MAAIFKKLRQAGNDAADHLVSTISDLDRQIAELNERKKKVEAERVQAGNALKAAADYPVNMGADYLCPICWVSNNIMSTLQPIPSPDRPAHSQPRQK
jgi:phage-related minor tail protein